jgi:ABC-type sugar transport system substrate-binding protein
MKFLTRFYTSLFLLIFMAAPVAAEKERMQVGYLSIGGSNSQFWDNMRQFITAVAEDLDVELIDQDGPKMAERHKEEGINPLDQLASGNYFILPYIGSVTNDLLESAHKRDIKIFLINVDVLEARKASIGKPREKYASWIAHSYADDVQAGYLAAGEIISKFPPMPSTPEKATVRMVGLTGPFTVQASFDRNNGLKKRVSETENTMLYEIQEADFDEPAAQKATKKLLDKYPTLNAIWAASDNMAMGAITALKASGRIPGKDVIIAGVDWTQIGIDAVKSGEMAATVGGHFMEAGIALMLIYDYHHGRDFADELGTVFKIPMYVVAENNVDTYLSTIGTHPDWSKIDFRKFTKTHNKDLTRYDFSWQRMLENMQ